MSEINLRAVPVLRILDYEEALDFYIQNLGFSVDWEHRFADDQPVYMQITRFGLVLQLSEHGRYRPGNIVFVGTTGLVRFRKLLLSGRPGLDLPEITETEWGTLQMEVEDPFGNLLRFNENV